MDTIEFTYPVFEANQVLTNLHLNDLFEYLDEQSRLTRANLIGIGIACGLEVALTPAGTVRLTRGCGITSEGYLIVEPTDQEFDAVRRYKPPVDIGYSPFAAPGAADTRYPMWELVTQGDANSQTFAASGVVLGQMAVVLLLELRQDQLRRCSPNRCDDRGDEVTVTVRRLLISVTDLDRVIEASNADDWEASGDDLTERLELPDLRLRRFDVPNTGPVDADAVLAGFQAPFSSTRFVGRFATALRQLYAAFRPLIDDLWSTDPFDGSLRRFVFLDRTPLTTAQARFMQYYWDLFDDLVAAYDEVRWKGVDLLCACCPPSTLHPRHLMVGVLDPAQHDVADYRHHFVASPAVADCVERTKEVRTLFRRLVAMVESFTEEAALKRDIAAGRDADIRITPSRSGDVPLSHKAIPYYYRVDLADPLYRLWDPVKTARNRAQHNLGYRSNEFGANPPEFVTEPLKFDLEPTNFLRVEGHLGRRVNGVLSALLDLRQKHRLPIEVIALRAGAFDENFEVDLEDETCRFEDLETLYDTLRSELVCFVQQQIRYFYELPLAYQSTVVEPTPPTIELLLSDDPGYRVHPQTVGRWIEDLRAFRDGTLPVAPQMTDAMVLALRSNALVEVLSTLTGPLVDDLRMVEFEAFSIRYARLRAEAQVFENGRRASLLDNEPFFAVPNLAERIDDVLFRCQLDPFEALAAEYRRRVREVKQAQYLGHFLTRHPGVQHKAGVPLGGTFILVYHETPERDPIRRPLRESQDRDQDQVRDRDKRREEAFRRLSERPGVAADPDFKFLFEDSTGEEVQIRDVRSEAARRVYLEALSELPNGAVIADFFLPYQSCSDCSPIHFSLPPIRLRPEITVGCTDAHGAAQVTIETAGASGNVSVQVDGKRFVALAGALLLSVGEHTIVVRDAAGAESTPMSITIAEHLAIVDAKVVADPAAKQYHVEFVISGGVPPYAADLGTVVDATYTSPDLPLDELLAVTITDAAGCTAAGRFESGLSECGLPCGGMAVRAGYRFWVPEARPALPIKEFKADVQEFTITAHDGTLIDISAEALEVLNKVPQTISSNDFGAVVARWLKAFNGLAADRLGMPLELTFEYQPPPEHSSTGTLWIDRLDCIEFSIELVISFTQGRVQRQLELRYDIKGTKLVENARKADVFIPAWDPSTSDKCHPDRPPVPKCVDVDLALAIAPEFVKPGEFIFRPEILGTAKIDRVVWEMQDAIPSMTNLDRAEVVFDPIEPAEKRVKITAYTEAGCTEVAEMLVDVSKPVG